MGLETARKLKARGMRVIITARNARQLEIAQKETGADFAFPMDITKYSDWEDAKRFVSEKFGGLDILLNNAGALRSSPFWSRIKIRLTVRLP